MLPIFAGLPTQKFFESSQRNQYLDFAPTAPPTPAIFTRRRSHIRAPTTKLRQLELDRTYRTTIS
eukprot:scaffold13909_cov310-Alexandrium_tamarense.AAC.2